jgi:membrane-bound lytic murein transglycosylase D
MILCNIFIILAVSICKLNPMNRTTFLLAGSLAVVLALIALPSFTGTDQLPIPSRSFLSQVVKSIDLDRSFTLGGDAVPMHNDDAKQRLDRELMLNAYQHANMLLNIKRSGTYFPDVERILAENGIPDDFKYLAVAESALGNVAVSSAGAKGLWQFMEGTGREYGLEINGAVDERLHFEKSTRAACKMLRNLHNKFGSWTMAAAAYNMGAGGLSRDMGNQSQGNYWDTHLNQETGRYVFRIIAIKDIMENPEAYGFFVKPEDKYPSLITGRVEVVESVPDLIAFALARGTTFRQIKVYNPWILGSSLPARGGKSYEIVMP